MSSLMFLPTALPVQDGSAVAPALAALLSTGLVGMSIKNVFDSILSDDESDDAGAEEEMADGGLMAEGDGDDAFGDLGGLEDDDGDMGGFGDDEFGGMDEAAGADNDELEHRLDELETEVGSLSSTVNTVRTENEQISESVEEVEENVRKLLDIYEMVTRGVNPFADDIEAGMSGGGMGGEGSFGLFDDDDGGEQAEEDIDDDIANADAEGFFDDDLVEDDGDDFGGGGSVDDMFDDGASESGDDPFEDDDGTFDEGFDDFEEDAGTDDDAGDAADGKSFQELKDEYESGDAEWADGEKPPDHDEEEGVADDENDALEADLEDDDLFDDVVEDDGFDDEEAAAVESAEPEPEPEPATTTDPEPATTAEPASEPVEETATEAATDADATAAADDDGKPYLATLPDGFASDLLVVEWLEYLLEQSSYRETSRAIEYYETIDWIDDSVADELQDHLRGFDDVDGGDGGLTIDHHTRSLHYISQLDGGGSEAVALSKLVRGGGADGLQR